MMRSAAFAIALLLGSAAIAQTATQPETMTPDTTTTQDSSTTATDMSTPSDSMATSGQQQTMTTDMASAGSQVVQPSNANPARDARGIKVISAEAIVPPGWNRTPGTAQGGPLLDPATGEPVARDELPACSATVTDRCLQTYERGRSA